MTSGQPARHAFLEPPFPVDRVLLRQVRLRTEPEIILTIHDRRVDDSGPLLDRDEIRRQDRPGRVGAGTVHRSRKQRLVSPAHQISPRERLEQLDLVRHRALHEGARDDQDLASSCAKAVVGAVEDSDLRVLDVLAHGEGDVAG